MRIIKNLNQSGFDHAFLGVAFVVAVGVVGAGLVVSSHAATTRWKGVLEAFNSGSGYCLSSMSGSSAAKVVLDPCKASDVNQSWSVNVVKTASVMGAGNVPEFYLQNGAGSNECLNDPYGSKKAGTPLQLYTCKSTDSNSLWVWGNKFTAKKLSAHELINLGSISSGKGLCLDDAYSSKISGNKVQLFTCSTTSPPNQSWFEDTAPSGSSTGSGSSSTSYWQPPQDANWMWEIGTPIATTNANLMGTGITAYNGDVSPSDNPTIYDVDGILNSASTVSTLHAAGDKAICYVEVGTAGNYYAAADEGIATSYFSQLQAAGDLSTNKLSGYPEYFVNINKPSAVTVIENMIDQQCANKGFDAVETDLDETFGNNEGTTPWTITQTNEETYLKQLASYMHSVHLGWIAKNLDDTSNSSFVSDMEPYAQGIVTEQCNQHNTCSLLSSFEQAHKWVGNAEYAPETQAEFCASDNAANINGVLFNVNLNGGREPCR